MGKRAYVFIDESGNHTQTDCYVLAGCWCISTYSDSRKVLEPTVNRLSNNFTSVPSGELKGEKLRDSTLDSVLVYLQNVVKVDKTIARRAVPWKSGKSIAYTIYDSDSDIGLGLNEQYFGEGKAKTTAQLVGLASLISPLFRISTHTNYTIDSHHVILDATTWERASYKLSTIISSIDWCPDVQFVTKDSSNIPGIQLADIAAYARRRYLRSGDCQKGAQAIDNLRL